MVNFRRLADQAKKIVDKRGGNEALKQDAQELKDIATGEGSLKDKAKAATEAVKEPGSPGEEARKPEPEKPRKPEPEKPGERTETPREGG
jgi:hypothetical protein